jgi:hypothetical protein
MVAREAQDDVTIVAARAHFYIWAGSLNEIPDSIPPNPPVREKGTFYGTKQQHAA